MTSLSDKLREIEDRMKVSELFSIEDRQTVLDAIRRIEDAEAEAEKQADRLEALEADLRVLAEEAPYPANVIASEALRDEGVDTE